MENIEAAMKRIPPHSIEAEQAVLGAMLMNKEAVMVASEIISGEDFYQTAYGILFDAMVELFHKGKPIDLITLQEHLKEKDVPPEVVVQAAVEGNIRLVGLSALMTTTVPAMQQTIAALREAGLPCRVMVGGAVLTPSYAAQIGADYYAKDAKAAADIARRVFGGEG